MAQVLPGGMLTASIDTYSSEVVLETLWRAAEMVRAGALTNSVMEAAYNVTDTKFNAWVKARAAASAPDDDNSLRHVFDYGETDDDLGRRLWKTARAGLNSSQTVSYTFLKSTRTVPVPEPLAAVGVERRHVFREKASILENAETLNINRKKAKMLVYMESKNSRKGNADGIVFSKGPSFIQQAGDGRYKNEFMNAFLLWWTTDLGAGGDLKMVAEVLGQSFAFRSARVAGAKARVASYTKQMKAKDATPEAKARAQEMIKAIKKQMTEYGKKGLNNVDSA